MVDLEKEHSYIHLSASSALIKRECFDNRCFDIGLSYAEDAQVIIDILLDKMQYGVISETNYIYRERESGDSAIDIEKRKVSYYIPYMEKFILYSLDNALKKRGFIPQFVQYACMYDLQWRLKESSLVDRGVISKDEEIKYKDLILKALCSIDNKIIVEQKNLGNNYKMAILLLKKENLTRKEIVLCSDDIKMRIRGYFTSVGVSAYTVVYEFLSVFHDKIVIEGYFRCFPELDNMDIVLK